MSILGVRSLGVWVWAVSSGFVKPECLTALRHPIHTVHACAHGARARTHPPTHTYTHTPTHTQKTPTHAHTTIKTHKKKKVKNARTHARLDELLSCRMSARQRQVLGQLRTVPHRWRESRAAKRHSQPRARPQLPRRTSKWRKRPLHLP